MTHARPVTCPHCGAPMTYVRGGARLSPLKARIFDVVKRAGPYGIAAGDLVRIVYDDDVAPAPETIKAHIWQINDKLAVGAIRSHGQRYVLEARG